MIGLDTNVLVRYVVEDEPGQSAAAVALIDGLMSSEPAFVSVVVTVETYWVLRRSYRLSDSDCLDVVDGLLAAAELRLERADLVRTAIDNCRDGGDFADALIAGLGRNAGCRHTVTFDRRASQLPGMELLAVAEQ